ncbi:type III-A CRISPR-associated RAMP protein Csm3 [Thermodesulfobacterium sp. TA1]|uniref:type III-A CRISPR-associated RAMP protein Csm3 n=1 Tax=Thermodesulfobacterium sp. TA1 TaxID=2234087 RepID=UPI001231FA48|nr:type III-A CRISPR-associated RAMP protein Csm3 [Thermodesulfobacterium sp. TA1]QER42719.1 type III-A CRISPR-associated RAMP protein Csm3 [Thermodesulfobacterium sp. TA1]
MEKTLQLQKIYQIKGKIKLLTGLHIGSGNTEMHIGGVDNLVVKNPLTNEPYIPGSSLKGKIRSLLEYYLGLPTYSENVDPNSGGITSHKLLNNNSIPNEIKEKATLILKLFGLSGSGEDVLKKIGPTRVAFADCFFTEDFKKKITNECLPFTEIKAENRINRITGTAEHPRFIERVPAGAEFDFQITLKIYNTEDEKLLEALLKGLKLLELDYLGGCGSRGYGRIKFEFEDEKIKEKFDKIQLFT